MEAKNIKIQLMTFSNFVPGKEIIGNDSEHLMYHNLIQNFKTLLQIPGSQGREQGYTKLECFVSA